MGHSPGPAGQQRAGVGRGGVGGGNGAGGRSSPFPGWPLLLGCHCCPLEPAGRGAPGHCRTTRLMWGPRGCIRREPSSACQLQPPAQASPPCPAACQPIPPNSGTRSPRGLFWPTFCLWMASGGLPQPPTTGRHGCFRGDHPPGHSQDGHGGRDGHSEALRGEGAGAGTKARPESTRSLRTQAELRTRHRTLGAAVQQESRTPSSSSWWGRLW